MLNRREFVGGLTALCGAVAGCSSGTNDDIGEGASPTRESTPSATTTGPVESSPFGGWMEDVSNFDGIVDWTDRSEVEIAVGAEGNGAFFAFAPAAIRISIGTTDVWNWPGKGGSHNVVAEDRSFESELTNVEGHTFEHTFVDAAPYHYYCEPHLQLGMKGVVVVE